MLKTLPFPRVAVKMAAVTAATCWALTLVDEGFGGSDFGTASAWVFTSGVPPDDESDELPVKRRMA